MSIEGFFFLNFNNFELNVTFKIDSNITAIIGESGSGKTTFLKCLSGIIKPQYSFLKINNLIIQNSKTNYFLHTNKRLVGHVLQSGILFNNLSVFENICLGFDKYFDNYINVFDIINYLNISKFLKKKVKNLSGGEKQLILIAQIILTQPKIILLDESFSSQDLNKKNKLLLFFKKINVFYKIPIIYVSHNIEDVKNFVTNILYMNKGKFLNLK